MELPDPELDEAMEASDSDKNAAAKVLLIAARYLRRGDRMPERLADFLADSIEKSMRMAASVRGSNLLINLKIKVNNVRPAKANWEYVGRDFEALLAKNVPVLQAKVEVASIYEISDSTVDRRYKQYLEFKSLDDAFVDDELRQYQLRSPPHNDDSDKSS